MPLNDVAMRSVNECEAPPASRRRIAGRDPFKRRRILEGAKRCFLDHGFEAASMTDIAAEAGVSKGTLYVYFQNKEDLFSALIDSERVRIVNAVEGMLDPDQPTAEALCRFGTAITAMVTADDVIRVQRMVLAVADRMPETATHFFGQQTVSARSVLCRFLKAKSAAGELAIADYHLAAAQLMELSMAWIFKSRLFGNKPEPYTSDEIARVVNSGVAMFLGHYGVRRSAPGHG